MGEIKQLHLHGPTDAKYQWRNYIGLELTENIHLHYRNIRLEFTPEEFLFIQALMSSLTPGELETIKTRKYGYDQPVNFLRISSELPPNDWWENSFDLEEQVNGMFHFHFGNLRIDLHPNDVKKIFNIGD